MDIACSGGLVAHTFTLYSLVVTHVLIIGEEIMCNESKCCCGSKHHHSQAEDRPAQGQSCGCGTDEKDKLEHLLECRRTLEAKLSNVNARIAALES